VFRRSRASAVINQTRVFLTVTLIEQLDCKKSTSIRCDGFLYSGGEGVEDANRRCEVSTTEQILGLLHGDLKAAYDASVDPTEAA